jgi:uncharacterized protein YjbI with pentapeptide repeats
MPQIEGFVLDLSGARVRRTNLSNANPTHANLSHADLTGANLSGADLSDVVNLTKEQLASAVIDDTTILPTYLQDLRSLIRSPEKKR